MDFMQKQQQMDELQAQQQIQEQMQQEAQQQIQQQIQQEAPQQIRQEAQQQMQQIQQQAQVNLPPANAHAAAAGEAVQQMAPARKTYKARRAEKRRAREEEKRHAAEAREHCPVGNIVTYDIKHQLEDYETQVRNSFDSYFSPKGSDQSEEGDMPKNLSGVDTGVLRFFSHGFRTDEAGRPATADDERYQQEDKAFYEVFCSTNYKKRLPYLQQMVEEVISLNLNDMFSDNSLRSHAAHMKAIAGRMVSMQNIVGDEHNKFFIDNLPVEKRKALDQAMAIGASYSAAFTAECHKRGVQTDGSYIKDEDKIKAYSVNEKDCIARYQEQMGPFQSVGAIKRAAIRRNSRINAESIWKTLAAERPAPEVYQQIRGLLEQDVQNLLDHKVEDLRALSDKDLRQLYAASLDVDKCLTLKHPKQSDYIGSPLTLKDDLIGQRGIEYEYKLAVLRGLVESSDGLKEQGKKTIKDAAKRYRNLMTLGTEEFKSFYEDLAIRNPSAITVIPTKFDEVNKKFWEAPTGEFAEAMERLRDKEYFSLADLAYSEEELKELEKQGRRLNIGEALFRSFDGLLKYEATQTLLTPEQFQQMLLNLGAGAHLTHDSSEKDREKAIEKNNAGLDTLRKVLTAQYEMLERKYGNSIEKLTIKDITEHYVDLEKDFANTQVDYHMAERFPGFIRKDNPDDEILFHRIQYYNMCGISLDGIISFIGIERAIPDLTSKKDARLKLSDENIQKYIGYALKDSVDAKDSKKAIDYLTKNSSSFKHPLDWSQKVKNPGDGN